MKSKMLKISENKLSLVKKFLITLVVVFSFQPVFGQSVFDKFDGQDDVFYSSQ
jgi:hypothetical protein